MYWYIYIGLHVFGTELVPIYMIFWLHNDNVELKYSYLVLENEFEFEFLGQWKVFEIIPIHNSGGKQNIAYYRAICKLLVIPKLFEKV